MRKRSIKKKFKQKVVRKIRTEKTNKTLFERVFCSRGSLVSVSCDPGEVQCAEKNTTN